MRKQLVDAFLGVWYRAPLWIVFTQLGVWVEISRAYLQHWFPQVQP